MWTGEVSGDRKEMTLDTASWLNLAIGTLELVLAGVVFRHIARFGRAFPWLVALMVFFVVRGADRIYAAFAGGESLGVTVDAFLVAVLVLLIVGIDRTTRALQAVRDEATYRRDEYNRALADYQRLARHRLANPLTAIRGSVETLREMPELDAKTRRELLDVVRDEARRLEEIALEPTIVSEEERGLDPRPDV